MERSYRKQISTSVDQVQHRWSRKSILVLLPVLILFLTQCGVAQQATSPSTPTPPPSSMIYLSDQAGVDVFQVPDSTLQWQLHLPVTTTGKLVVDQGQTTAYFATDRLYALNAHTGKQEWMVTIDKEATALAVSGSMVYVASPDDVYALNTQDGSLRWHQPLSASFDAIKTFLIRQNVIYLSQGGSVLALDAATGKQRWHFEVDPGLGESITDLLQAENMGVLLVQSRSTLDALDELTGQRIWHRHSQTLALKVVGETLYTVFLDVPDPATSEKSPPFPTTDPSGLRAVHMRDGKQVWQVTTPIAENGFGAIAATAIYWVSGHDITAWSAESGQQIWKRTDTDTYASLAASDHVVVTETSHGDLIAVQSENGKPLWKQSSPTNTTTHLAVEYGEVYSTDPNGTIVAFSLEQGSQLWHLIPESPVEQMLILKHTT